MEEKKTKILPIIELIDEDDEEFEEELEEQEKETEPGEVFLPSTEQLRAELERVKYKGRYSRVLRSTVSILVTAAAIAILVATLWMPVLQIYGSSMEPILEAGQYVACVKENRFYTGDIVAFYLNNKILVKRVIGNPGDWVDIDDEGNVYVNGDLLSEPYLTGRDKGTCDISLPYQVPEGRLFVMGDNRAVSLDSRSTAVGCVSEEQLVGRLTFVVWPLSRAGRVK